MSLLNTMICIFFCDGRAVELLDKTLTIEEVLDKVFQMKCAGISLIKYKNNEENT